MRVFHIHMKATEAKLCLLSFCSTAAKLCFEVITQICIKGESMPALELMNVNPPRSTAARRV